LVSTAYTVALIASFLWFLAGFRYFSFQQTAAARILVPGSARTSPLFPTVAAGLRFLGGMNGAFALLAAILLVLQFTGSELFNDPRERGVLLIVFGIAHFSQFAFNLPIIKGGQRQGETYWPVLSGPMLYIFIGDALDTVINIGAAVIQFASVGS
jgi:hypothetical protein